MVDFNFSVNGPEVSFTSASTNAESYTWDFGDGTTNTEANPDHTFPGIGEYEVTLSVANECGFVTLTQTVIVTSTTAVDYLDESAFQMSVAPNPFHNQFMLGYDLSDTFNEAHVAIYNVLGEQLATQKLTTKSGTLLMGNDLSQNGVYFLRLVVDGQVGKALRVVKM